MPSLEWVWTCEKKDAFVKGGCLLDDDGYRIVAVFDLRDGGEDECR